MLLNREDIGIPTLEIIKKYVEDKGFDIDVKAFYSKYKKNGWFKSNGKPIKDLGALLSAYNGIKKQKKHNRDSSNKTLRKNKFISYPKQLKDKRWLKFRNYVLNTRGHKCEICGSINNLNVHHIRYKTGCYAWEYKVKDMQVLCHCCHQKVHGITTSLHC